MRASSVHAWLGPSVVRDTKNGRSAGLNQDSKKLDPSTLKFGQEEEKGRDI